MTPQLILSESLRQQLSAYHWQRCTDGMSPARVYRLQGPDHALYLKTVSPVYAGSTYDVQREKDMLEWLQGKLPVPEVLHFEQSESGPVLVMTEAPGQTCAQAFAQHQDPYAIIAAYAEAIHSLQAISIADCPYDNRISHRLAELKSFLDQGLADTDPAHWEADTPFERPQDLFDHLVTQAPDESLVLSHGDLGDSNLFVSGGRVSALIDLGRTGKADRWYDIAFCVRTIQQDLGPEPAYCDAFFKALGLAPDWDKIRYFILLDELF